MITKFDLSVDCVEAGQVDIVNLFSMDAFLLSEDGERFLRHRDQGRHYSVNSFNRWLDMPSDSAHIREQYNLFLLNNGIWDGCL